MGQYAQELGDNPKYVQSDITRANKIYFVAAQIFSGFTNSWFREQLEAAYAAACKRGIKKRVPFFFTTLENRMQFSVEELAFVRSDDALYADGDISDFVARLKRQYEKSSGAWTTSSGFGSPGSPPDQRSGCSSKRQRVGKQWVRLRFLQMVSTRA